MSSGWRPWTLTSKHACSPSSRCGSRARTWPGRTSPRCVPGGCGHPEQLLERQAGDLAADAVEAGEDDGVRRVVDDDVDAGEVLERADVAAFAADDAALHVVGRELDDATRWSRRRDRPRAAASPGRGCCGRGARRCVASPPRPRAGGQAGLDPRLVLELLHQHRLRLRGRPMRDMRLASWPSSPCSRRSVIWLSFEPACSLASWPRASRSASSEPFGFSSARVPPAPRRRWEPRAWAWASAWGLRLENRDARCQPSVCPAGQPRPPGPGPPRRRDGDSHCFSSTSATLEEASAGSASSMSRRGRGRALADVGGGGEQEGDHHGRLGRWRLSRGVRSVKPGAPARMRCLMVSSEWCSVAIVAEAVTSTSKMSTAGFSRRPGGSAPVAGEDGGPARTARNQVVHSKAATAALQADHVVGQLELVALARAACRARSSDQQQVEAGRSGKRRRRSASAASSWGPWSCSPIRAATTVGDRRRPPRSRRWMRSAPQPSSGGRWSAKRWA